MTALILVTGPATEPVSIAELMTHCRIDQANQELAPSVITAALASPAAPGNVDAGAHRYRGAFVTADGETEGGTVSAAVTVADAGTNGQVELTNIPIGGSLVTSRKLYRTEAGGAEYLLLATIADNTTTTYTDNIADSSLGAGAPSTNSTSDPQLATLIKSARGTAESRTRRAFVTQTWDLMLDCFPAWTINIPKPPLQSVTSISYVDSDGNTQVLDADQYLVDTSSEPARITPAFGLVWPIARWQTNAVTVRFVAGYGAASAVPDGLKLWMKTRIKHLYDNPGQLSVGLSVAEFPRAFVDGMLDEYVVTDFSWAA